MKTIYRLLALAGLIALLGAVTYCWQNRSGHSGFTPWITLAFFGPLFLAGLMERVVTKGRILSARFVELIGLMGIAFPFFVTKLGILNQYEKWIEAGMPDRAPHGNLLLAAFLVVGLGLALAIALLSTPQGRQDAAHRSSPHRECNP